MGLRAPYLFCLGHVDLDHHHTYGHSHNINHGFRNVIAPQTRCGAQGEEPPLACFHCIVKIWAKTKISPDERNRLIPVTGRQGRATSIQNICIGCLGRPVEFFQQNVCLLTQARIVGCLQNTLNGGMQGINFGQRLVSIKQFFQTRNIKAQGFVT